jgi:hypothetical protein
MTKARATVDAGTSPTEVRATVALGNRRAHVSIRGDELDATPGDALTCLALLPALVQGAETLEVSAPVSEQLLGRTRTLGEIFRRWLAVDAASVDVRAEPVRLTPQPGLASFFSGGVDSWYTALTRADELDALVFVRGFDLYRAESDLIDLASSNARAAARNLGLQLLEVDADVRDFSDRLVSWEMYHGSALAGVAHAVGWWGRMLVPATLEYRHMAPWGSHPWTDPLWSSERVAIEDDGVWASRLDKIAYLAEHDVALEHLRVCWRIREGGLNCGRCAKCLETILALELVGASGRCLTLPATVDVAAWEELEPPSWDFVRRSARSTRVVGHLRDLLEAGGPEHPVGPELRRMLAPYDQIETRREW